jgi:DNA-directed RNA polymerase specialized sigma24 family protein
MAGPAADRDLLAALAEEDFQGPGWDRFAHGLASYGINVIRGWIMTGRIFAELRARGIRHGAGTSWHGQMTSADATDIAVETVARAIVSFRDKMLVNGRWSPEGGASITTLFITQCLFQFPNAHRYWKKERGPARELPDDLAVSQQPHLGGGDPEQMLIGREQQIELINNLPSDLIRAAVQLMSEGHSVREAAEHLGVKPKKIDNALTRYRQKKRPQEEKGRTKPTD